MDGNIFNENVQRYLLEFGIPEIEITKIVYREYKKFCVERLQFFIELINADNFPDLKKAKQCFFSPAGDGHGDNNFCINFDAKDFDPNNNPDRTIDISEAFQSMKLMYDEINKI